MKKKQKLKNKEKCNQVEMDGVNSKSSFQSNSRINIIRIIFKIKSFG